MRSVEQAWRRWLPPLLGLVVLAVCVNLGMWQLRRAGFKTELQRREAAVQAMQPQVASGIAELVPDRRVALRGTWVPEHGVLIDNRSHRRQAGYHLLMPLRLNNGQLVIVNRGWLAARLDRKLPMLSAPGGVVSLNGRTQDPDFSRGYTLGEVEPGAPLWPRNDMTAWRTRLGAAASLGHVLVLQESASDDGLVREWATADFGADKHRAYALQWFSLAAMAAGLTGWWFWRTARRSRRV